MYAFATQSAAVATAKGIPVNITEGSVWNASDPIVKAYPSFFSDEPKRVERSVPTEAEVEAAKKAEADAKAAAKKAEVEAATKAEAKAE